MHREVGVRKVFVGGDYKTLLLISVWSCHDVFGMTASCARQPLAELVVVQT